MHLIEDRNSSKGIIHEVWTNIYHVKTMCEVVQNSGICDWRPYYLGGASIFHGFITPSTEMATPSLHVTSVVGRISYQKMSTMFTTQHISLSQSFQIDFFILLKTFQIFVCPTKYFVAMLMTKRSLYHCNSLFCEKWNTWTWTQGF